MCRQVSSVIKLATLLIMLAGLWCPSLCAQPPVNQSESDPGSSKTKSWFFSGSDERAQIEDLRDMLKDFADELISGLENSGVERIMVMDPKGPHDYLTELSAFLVHGIQSSLIKKRREGRLNIKVMDRHHLNEITIAGRMEMTGYYDQSTVIKLGRRLGVDSVVYMEVGGAGNSLFIRGKVINPETTEILSTAGLELERTSAIDNLLDERLITDLRIILKPWVEGAIITVDNISYNCPQKGLLLPNLDQGLKSISASAGSCFAQDLRCRIYLAAPRTLRLAPELQSVALGLHIIPAESRVLIDNELPVALDWQGNGSIQLDPGPHSLLLQHKNKVVEEKITMGCRPVLLKRSLNTPRHDVTLRITPANSRVRLDGETIELDDQGNWRGVLTQGEHSVLIKAGYHEDYNKPLRIEREGKQQISLIPIKYPVQARVSPPDAVVTVAGRKMKQNSEDPSFYEAWVAAGLHTMKAGCSYCRSVEKTVRVPTRRTVSFDLARMPLEVAFSAICEINGEAGDLTPGSVLPSGTDYKISISSKTGAYVYVIHVDSQGKMKTWFPNNFPEFKPQRNPLRPNEQVWIPPNTPSAYPNGEIMWLRLDNNHGRERIYVLASHAPDPQTERLVKLINRPGSELSAKEAARELLRITRARGSAIAAKQSSKLHTTIGSRHFHHFSRILESLGVDKYYVLEFIHQ